MARGQDGDQVMGEVSQGRQREAVGRPESPLGRWWWGFLEDRLQDHRAITVKNIMFIAVFALVLSKTITWEGKLHYRCGGLKPY
jgi:hypothetical protein